MPRSAQARVTPAGLSTAMSCANDGPDRTATGVPGSVSAMTCDMKAQVPRSMPFEQVTTGYAALEMRAQLDRDGAHVLRRWREQEEVSILRGRGEIVRGHNARRKGNTRQKDRIRRVPIDRGRDFRLARPDDGLVAGTTHHARQRGAERASSDHPHPRHRALPSSTLVWQTRGL